MKFLTLHQPWATLIAEGVKTIETRSWATPYRGRLGVHAGKGITRLDEARDAWSVLVAGVYEATRSTENTRRFPPNGQTESPLPLGALVAVCDLVDVVPISGRCSPHPVVYSDRFGAMTWGPQIEVHDGGLTRCDRQTRESLTDQLPFGDFTPGRFAWLLDNVRALPEPIPMRGAQGLRDLPADVEKAVMECVG